MLNYKTHVERFASKHRHKKRKDSLETRAEPAAFCLQLEFRKLLEPSLSDPASNINKQVRGTVEQLKVKGLLRALC